MTTDEQRRQFEQKLKDPDAKHLLYEFAVALREAGRSQREVYDLYIAYQEKIDPVDDESNRQYDAIVDNLDLIAGGPWAKGNGIFPTPLED